ncbi:NPCBM/NEW2 domain-containing protein [Pontiella agarivorans]
MELSERQREVRLVVTTAGDGNTGDFANWVNAGFSK